MIHITLGSVALHARQAATPSPVLWYFTRATALSAYLLLTVTVILGMLRSIARNARERLSWVNDEMHLSAATLMVGMMLGHLISLNLDPYLPFRVLNLLVPVNEPYRPLGVNLGVFAMYSVVLVATTSWLRRFMAYRVWRLVHYVSFLTFILVTLHGWISGSDSDEPWMRAIYIASAASVAFLVIVRLFSSAPQSSASAVR